MVYKASGPLVLVGAGNMGGAMLSGWLKKGVPGSKVIVIDPRPFRRHAHDDCGGRRAHTVKPSRWGQAGVLFVR